MSTDSAGAPTEPARICFIAHSAWGEMSGGTQGEIGGIQRQLSIMARWFAARGHTVSMLTLDEGQPEEVVIDGVRVIRMCRQDEGLPGLRFVHPRWTSLIRAMRRADAQVYYQNTSESATGQAAHWCRGHGRGFVFSVANDHDVEPQAIAKHPWRQRFLYQYGLKHADLVAARAREAARTHGLLPGKYGLVTLHRPSNVDDPAVLRRLLETLREMARRLPLVFAMHPRTRKRIEDGKMMGEAGPRGTGLICVGPQSYLESLSLMADAAIVITDSGGIQEESSVLHVPCLTVRDNTERPVTVRLGTNRLVGNDPQRIRAGFDDVVAGRWPRGSEIPNWDGRAGERVAGELAAWLAGRRSAA